MKNSLKIVLFVLLLCGVFGADEYEVKSVSVLEGDSLTLNTDPTQIKGFIKIQWRFGETLVAQTRGIESSYEDEVIFKDRLELNQTGSLTIKNMRTKHSGLYKLQVDHSTGTSNQKFRVTVNESPFVDAIEFVMKSMSVTEGDPVTLQTDVTELHGDELIVWRFGDEGKLIAKHDKEAKSSPLYDETDERFRDRLQVNDKTGSLIITNTRITDSGLYAVKISSDKQTSYKRFALTVSVPGLSPAAVAGIVVVVLLASAAVAAGVMYFCRSRTTNLPSQTWSVLEGDNITLNPETEIHTGDEIQWLFREEDVLIAQIRRKNREMTIYEGADEIFRDKLKPGETTGSLTIKSIRTKHTGLYTLKIRRGRETLYKRFFVSVERRMRSVMEGDPVTLEPETEIQTDDEIQWLFDDKEQQTVLAKIKTTEVTKHDGTDERFRDRLELNKETGSLTITKFTAEHTGFYTLKIRRRTETSYKRFFINAEVLTHEERKIEMMEGESVTLIPATEINKDDSILWLFGDKEQQTLIAEIKGETKIFTQDDVPGGRFRDRLELNETTGSLTIKRTRTAHSGSYHLQITSSSGLSGQTFIVTVNDKVEERLLEGEEFVTLNPDTEIQKDDQILWMFGDQDKLIAQIKGGTVEIYDDANKRFKGRLKLDETTGSLTITDITTEHTGLYKLLTISRSRGNLCKKFKVLIQMRYVSVTAGDSVTLKTGLTERQTDDEIQWMFGDENSLIAEIKGGTVKTYDGPDERFRDRLELNKTTGDLIISNSTSEHAGCYNLKICSSKGKTIRTYIVIIRVRNVSVIVGEPVHLYTGLTGKQKDVIQWMFGDKDSIIALIEGGTVKTNDGPDKRFRDRLKLNKMTGDLTIKNSTDEHAGCYNLKICSSKVTTYLTYIVNIRARYVSVTAGDSVHLYTGLTGKQTDDEIQWMFRDENSLIAEIKGGTVKTYDGPDERFRDRLELNKTTGDLTIRNSTTEHAGRYKLKICSSEGTTYWTYSVIIRGAAVTDEARKKSVMKEKNVSTEKRGNESATVVMPLLSGDDLDEVNEGEYVNVMNEEEGTSSL